MTNDKKVECGCAYPKLVKQGIVWICTTCGYRENEEAKMTNEQIAKKLFCYSRDYLVAGIKEALEAKDREWIEKLNDVTGLHNDKYKENLALKVENDKLKKEVNDAKLHLKCGFEGTANKLSASLDLCVEALKACVADIHQMKFAMQTGSKVKLFPDSEIMAREALSEPSIQKHLKIVEVKEAVIEAAKELQEWYKEMARILIGISAPIWQSYQQHQKLEQALSQLEEAEHEA